MHSSSVLIGESLGNVLCDVHHHVNVCSMSVLELLV